MNKKREHEIYTAESVKKKNYNKSNKNSVGIKCKTEVHNKIEYCLGNCFALLSASLVIALCQDSSVFLRRKFPLSIT